MTSDVENSKVLGVGFTVKNNCFNAILEYTIVFNSCFKLFSYLIVFQENS